MFSVYLYTDTLYLYNLYTVPKYCTYTLHLYTVPIHCTYKTYTLYLTLPIYCTYITLAWESSRNLPSGELCSSCCSLSSFASMSMAKVMNPRVRGGVNKRLCLWKLMQRSSWSWSAITYFANFCSCWVNLTHLNAKKISNSRVRFSGETKI